MADTKVANRAVEQCLKVVMRAAAPWRIPRKLIQDLRVTFRPEFQREIGNAKAWTAWAHKARLLARHVGALTAFEADKTAGFPRNPTTVSRAHVEAAVQRVADACTVKTNGARTLGRLCGTLRRSKSGHVRLGVPPVAAATNAMRIVRAAARSRR